MVLVFCQSPNTRSKERVITSDKSEPFGRTDSRKNIDMKCHSRTLPVLLHHCANTMNGPFVVICLITGSGPELPGVITSAI